MNLIGVRGTAWLVTIPFGAVFAYSLYVRHPFADDNGRVGRAIVFRECLRGGLVPLIDTDETKDRYYRGLRVYARTGRTDELVGYFKDMRRPYLGLAAQLLDDDPLRRELYERLPEIVPNQAASLDFVGEPSRGSKERSHNAHSQ